MQLTEQQQAEIAQAMKGLMETFYNNIPMWTDYYKYTANKRKMEFDSLIKQGFTESQALTIVAQSSLV